METIFPQLLIEFQVVHEFVSNNKDLQYIKIYLICSTSFFKVIVKYQNLLENLFLHSMYDFEIY